MVCLSPGRSGFARYALADVVDHRDLDHGFGALVEGLVVACESSVEHQPTDSPLHDPTARHDREAADLLVSVDDFGVDAEGCGVFDELVLEAGVDQCFYYRGVICFGLVDCGYSGVVVGDGGGEDDHGEEQAEGVGDDGPLPAGRAGLSPFSVLERWPGQG